MKICLKAMVFCVLLVSISISSFAFDYPKNQGRVSDFARILSTAEKNSLEAVLKNLDSATTIELAVVTIPSLEGMSVEEYSLGLAKAWGVGKKEKNNGIVFLVAPNDRKMRIEVGKGLESILSNSRCSQILDDEVKPYFRQNRLGEGIEVGVKQIILTLNQESSGQTGQATNDKKCDPKVLLFLLGIIVVIGAIIGSGFFVAKLLRLSKQKKDNQKLAEEFYKGVFSFRYDYYEAQKILDQLTRNNPEKVINDIKNDFNKISLSDVEVRVNKLLDESGSKSIFQAEAIQEALKDLGKDFNYWRKYLRAVNDRKLRIENCKAASILLLGVLPDDLSKGKVFIDHPDVSDQTKQLLSDCQAEFENIKDVASQENQAKVNWLDCDAQLNSLKEIIESVYAKTQSDKNLADKARTEGPELLNKIPKLLEELEAQAKHSSKRKKLEEARRQYDQAMANQNSGIDILHLYIALVVIDSLCSEAQAMPSSDYHGHSSDYSSSNSSSYDGGSSISFGGGDFGGGGASSSW